jgi:DNA replication protein DnaC
MNLIELQRALGQLRLGGMAAVLETRLRQAQAEPMAPIDLISCLVADELTRRSDRLLERRRKQAAFRDPQRTLDNFDFSFNPKMNQSLVHVLLDDLAEAVADGTRKEFMESLTTVPFADHRRLRNAQAAYDGGRGSAGDRHAPL